MYNNEENKIKFEWSLRPFIVCMKFILGLNLNTTKRHNKLVHFVVPAFGLFVIICNLAVNGQCGIFSFYKYKRGMDAVSINKGEEALFANELKEKDAIMLLIKDFCRLPIFLSTPIIHLVFIANVLLSKNWTKLWSDLKIIQKKLKLGEEFHQKCRQYCLVALLLLILVNIFF